MTQSIEWAPLPEATSEQIYDRTPSYTHPYSTSYHGYHSSVSQSATTSGIVSKEKTTPLTSNWDKPSRSTTGYLITMPNDKTPTSNLTILSMGSSEATSKSSRTPFLQSMTNSFSHPNLSSSQLDELWKKFLETALVSREPNSGCGCTCHRKGNPPIFTYTPAPNFNYQQQSYPRGLETTPPTIPLVFDISPPSTKTSLQKTVSRTQPQTISNFQTHIPPITSTKTSLRKTVSRTQPQTISNFQTQIPPITSTKTSLQKPVFRTQPQTISNFQTQIPPITLTKTSLQKPVSRTQPQTISNFQTQIPPITLSYPQKSQSHTISKTQSNTEGETVCETVSKHIAFEDSVVKHKIDLAVPNIHHHTDKPQKHTPFVTKDNESSNRLERLSLQEACRLLNSKFISNCERRQELAKQRVRQIFEYRENKQSKEEQSVYMKSVCVRGPSFVNIGEQYSCYNTDTVQYMSIKSPYSNSN